MTREGVCECGHPAESHGHVPGFEFSADVTMSVGDDPTQYTGMPDVWVCEGGRLVGDPENASPWDFVCGCVLHHDPRPLHVLPQIGTGG